MFDQIKLTFNLVKFFFRVCGRDVVGLSNILNSEFRRRKPSERSHRKVVGTTVMNGELLCEIIQRVKSVAGIEAFLILV